MGLLKRLNPFKEKIDSQKRARQLEGRESSVKEQIALEARRLEENTLGLKNEIEELGGKERIKEALDAHPKIKRGLLRKCSFILCVIAGLAVGHGLKKEFFEMADSIDEMFAESGKYNFSVDKVSKQRAWLRKWIEERKIRSDDSILTQKRAIDLLDAIKITHEDLGEEMGGEYIPYGKRRIALNIKKDKEEIFKSTPVHEFTHASNESNLLIAKKERKIIEEVVKNFQDYKKDSKQSDKDYYSYASSPGEFKAFLMGFRMLFDLKPNQTVDDKMIDNFYDRYKRGIKDNNVDAIMIIIKDREALKRALNELSWNEPDQDRGKQSESVA